VQERLALAATAEQVAGLAAFLQLPHMAADRFPTLDLPAVLVGQAATHVKAAIPLEPAPRIVRMNPAFAFPFRQRLARIDTKKLQAASRPRGDSFAPANQLLGNSRRQSVMYLPPNTPTLSIWAGVSCGLNSGSKRRPAGRAQHVAVALLHLVVDDDGTPAHRRN
jgi:hypothetical protein